MISANQPAMFDTCLDAFDKTNDFLMLASKTWKSFFLEKCLWRWFLSIFDFSFFCIFCSTSSIKISLEICKNWWSIWWNTEWFWSSNQKHDSLTVYKVVGIIDLSLFKPIFLCNYRFIFNIKASMKNLNFVEKQSTGKMPVLMLASNFCNSIFPISVSIIDSSRCWASLFSVTLGFSRLPSRSQSKRLHC